MKKQCGTLKVHLPSESGGGKLFLSLKDTINPLKQQSRSSWWNCYDIAIKKNENLMKLCIRIQFIQSYWKNLVAEWDKIDQRDWLQAIHEGSNKTRFEYCKTSKDHEIHVLAIHGQTGGNMTSPELMGHAKNSIWLAGVRVPGRVCSRH